MATTSSSYPNQAKTEAVTAHVLWMTIGLSCEGDSVAMTSATNPSLEDIITGASRACRKVVVHNQVIAYEIGAGVHRRPGTTPRHGKLDPFVLIIEGSLGNEKINGDGPLDGLRRQPRQRPADHDQRVGRPAGAQGRGGRRDRDLRDLRRHPGDEEQPDRRDGRARLPRLELEVQGRFLVVGDVPDDQDDAVGAGAHSVLCHSDMSSQASSASVGVTPPLAFLETVG